MATHLTPMEREELSLLLHSGHSKAEIARRLKRPPTTIFRELKRNRFTYRFSGKRTYCAVTAQQLADQRRHEPRTKKMQRPEIRDYVQQHLQQYGSPDQIAGRMRVDFPDDPPRRISHQTIYPWINHHDHRRRWRQYLRRHRVRKRCKTTMSDKAAIADRPQIIERRQRLGDWEGDTILGAARSGGLVSLVERQSGYLVLAKVSNRRSDTVNRAIYRRLKPLPESKRHSITFDNGSEFAGHEQLARWLGLDVYFAQPHSPWQRGTCENTNGLTRQFLPKGTCFREISQAHVTRIQTLLNERPRQRLGYQTPREAFHFPASNAMLT